MTGDKMNRNRILDAENHLTGVSGDLTPEKLNALLSEPKEKDQYIPQRH